ncbi:MAG: proline--tRNA ligase, partial [Clostridiales bacterium]|nr:proline--tRNA ligase [Clostridiales bacterium]
MKMSQMFIPTLREDPAEAEVVSHKLMLRAGLMRKLASGIYAYLPLGYRTFRKIEQIIREEMDRIGAQELMMSSLLPAENYQASGRWGVFGPEMFKLKDRNKRDFCLGPTHEEVFTEIVKNETRSYRSLPMTLYQIQTKFRDERRPRFGVMRCREFVMKDAYSFDRDDKGLDLSYRRMSEAYRRAFDRCGLDYIVVEADSGAMGGAGSQEFMVKSDVGEAVIAFCTSCGYAANDEKARCVPASYNPEKVANTANSANNTCTDDNTNTVNITNITNTADNTDNANNVKTDKASIKPLSKVATPDARTIEELVRFFDCTSISFAKTMIYKADEKYVVAVVRGDREINETKLKNYLVCSDLELADAEAVRAITGAEVGFAGLVGLKMTQSGISSHGSVIIDEEVALMENFITGANETGYHLANVNIERDFPAFVKADIRNIAAGDPCPVCGQLINISRGIEVGHVFKLGTKYSKALECVYLDESGKENPMVMGSY